MVLDALRCANCLKTRRLGEGAVRCDHTCPRSEVDGIAHPRQLPLCWAATIVITDCLLKLLEVPIEILQFLDYEHSQTLSIRR